MSAVSLIVTFLTAFIASSPADAVTLPPVINTQPSPSAGVPLVSVESSRYATLDAFALIASPAAVMLIVPPAIVSSISACIPSPLDIVPSVSVIVFAVMLITPPFIVTFPPSTTVSPVVASVTSSGSLSDFIPSPPETTVTDLFFFVIFTELSPLMPLLPAFTYKSQTPISRSSLQRIPLPRAELAVILPSPFTARSFLLYMPHALSADALNVFSVSAAGTRVTFPDVALKASSLVFVTFTLLRLTIISSSGDADTTFI